MWSNLFSTGIAARTVLARCTHPLSSEHKCWNVALETQKFPFHSKSLHDSMIYAEASLLLLTQTDRYCSVLRKTPLAAKAARILRKSSCWSSKAYHCHSCARALLLLLLERQLCLHLSQTSAKQMNKTTISVVFAILTSKQTCLWWRHWPHAALAMWMHIFKMLWERFGNGFQTGLRLIMWRGQEVSAAIFKPLHCREEFLF